MPSPFAMKSWCCEHFKIANWHFTIGPMTFKPTSVLKVYACPVDWRIQMANLLLKSG